MKPKKDPWAGLKRIAHMSDIWSDRRDESTALCQNPQGDYVTRTLVFERRSPRNLLHVKDARVGRKTAQTILAACARAAQETGANLKTGRLPK